jgi:creatinine amidohydrolase
MLWHELTWREVDALSKELPVVIPLAACEQHGHHLPVFVDTIQVTAIAERVERQMADQMLLLPTLWLGSSHHHKDFPGTISLRPLLYAQVIQEIARSVLEAGFRKIFFLNGHGGNRVPAADALGDLVATDNRADDAYLVLANWWEVGQDALRPEKLGLEQPVVSHACGFETSLMLALRPDLVQLERIQDQVPVLQNDWFHSEDDSSKKVAVFRRFHRLSASGVLGRPQEASLEAGPSILEGVTHEVVAFLNDFATWPELPILKN